MYVGLKQPLGDGERCVTPARAAAKETSSRLGKRESRKRARQTLGGWGEKSPLFPSSHASYFRVPFQISCRPNYLRACNRLKQCGSHCARICVNKNKGTPRWLSRFANLKDTISELFQEEHQTFPSWKRRLSPTQEPAKHTRKAKDKLTLSRNENCFF